MKIKTGSKQINFVLPGLVWTESLLPLVTRERRRQKFSFNFEEKQTEPELLLARGCSDVFCLCLSFLTFFGLFSLHLNLENLLYSPSFVNFLIPWALNKMVPTACNIPLYWVHHFCKMFCMEQNLRAEKTKWTIFFLKMFLHPALLCNWLHCIVQLWWSQMTMLIFVKSSKSSELKQTSGKG